MKNVHMCYIGVTEGNIENLKKRRLIEDKHLHFHLHNTLCITESVHFIILNRPRATVPSGHPHHLEVIVLTYEIVVNGSLITWSIPIGTKHSAKDVHFISILYQVRTTTE